MLSPENVATPLTAAWVKVGSASCRVGVVLIAAVMLPVNPLAVLPLASWAVTWSAAVIAAPATVLVGWTLKTSAVAVPAVMLNAVLVVLPAPVAVRVSPVHTSSMHSRGKVATPATAGTDFVPDKVPMLGFVPIATVLLPVNPLA